MKITPQQPQITTSKTQPLSVGGGIGQPDPKALSSDKSQLKLADDVVTLSVGGGIGQPDPKMSMLSVGGGIGQPDPKVSQQSVGGGIGQPDPRFIQEDSPSANLSVSV
ncbi:hypothetical protein [Shewanella sp.]|uniref:hypothetical protein n=1 Tax=Shewanella sp. TaxID=50422 RepID=UPI004054446E